jgi:hypothetical protein
MYETSILYCSGYCQSRRMYFGLSGEYSCTYFFVIKLLSLLFMCVPFLYRVSFHTHNTGALLISNLYF